MKTTRSNWTLAGFAALALLFVAGCSSDGKDGRDGARGEPGRTVIVHDR